MSSLKKSKCRANLQSRDIILIVSVAEEECAFTCAVFIKNHLLIEMIFSELHFLNDEEASSQTLQPRLMSVGCSGCPAVCLWY